MSTTSGQKIQKLTVGINAPTVATLPLLVSRGTFTTAPWMSDSTAVFGDQTSSVADVSVVGNSSAAFNLYSASKEHTLTIDSTGAHVITDGDYLIEPTGTTILSTDLKTLGSDIVFAEGNTVNTVTVRHTDTFSAPQVVTFPELSGKFVLDAGTQSIAGDKTFTGTISVPTPTAPGHAATKGYVDSVATGLDFKQSVRASSASLSNVPLTGSTPLVIDGITVADGNRLLLAAQTTASQNGIYEAAISGGSYTLTRAADADSGAEVNSGMFAYVEEGTVNAGYAFVLATANPITLDTTSLDFVIFNQSLAYTAGNGLTLTSNTFAVANTISTVNFEASGYVQTGSIQPVTPGGTIGFNSADLSSIDKLTAAESEIPTMNSGVNWTLGGTGNTATISASTLTLDAPITTTSTLSIDDTLTIAKDSNQIVLGTTSGLTISAATNGITPVTYTVPITTTSATFAMIKGSAPASADYVLKSAGDGQFAEWTASVVVPSIQNSITTTSTSAADLITLATSSNTSYLLKLDIVARRSDNSDLATYEIHFPVKNVSGTLTIGASLFDSAAWDAGFSGSEISLVVDGTSIKVRTTPTSSASTNWKAYMSYFSTV